MLSASKSLIFLRLLIYNSNSDKHIHLGLAVKQEHPHIAVQSVRDQLHLLRSQFKLRFKVLLLVIKRAGFGYHSVSSV